MFFKHADHLTRNLTSYDFLKCITVLFMFADHIGAFLLPDEIWWRVVGRLGFPTWFFLAGYSDRKDITPTLWIGAGLLFFENIMFGGYVFPANALVSFICIRLFMSYYYKNYFAGWEILLYATVALIILAYPTGYLFEYGTLAFLFAMFGYAVRHKDELGIGNKVRILFCATVVVSVVTIQNMIFKFDMAQGTACFLLMGAMSLILFHFKRAEYPELTSKLPKLLTSFIQIGGRYTLEIYVLHLMAIKAYVFFTAPDGYFEWFSPVIFPKFM